MGYSGCMLSGFRVFTSDQCWREILADLGATLVDNAATADADIDSMKLKLPVSPVELKSAIIGASDKTAILNKLFCRRVDLSPTQTQIVVCLYKSGGMTATELKKALGYAPDATTHTVDTVIYSLRKLFGRDFIKNING